VVHLTAIVKWQNVNESTAWKAVPRRLGAADVLKKPVLVDESDGSHRSRESPPHWASSIAAILEHEQPTMFEEGR
jgi:hypothetical protein